MVTAPYDLDQTGCLLFCDTGLVRFPVAEVAVLYGLGIPRSCNDGRAATYRSSGRTAASLARNGRRCGDRDRGRGHKPGRPAQPRKLALIRRTWQASPGLRSCDGMRAFRASRWATVGNRQSWIGGTAHADGADA